MGVYTNKFMNIKENKNMLIWKALRKTLKTFFKVFLEILILPFLLIAAVVSSIKNKKIDIGIGPDPLINNIYHKAALNLYGYKSETFVNDVYWVTSNFDIRGDLLFRNSFLSALYLFFRSIFTYKAIYIYFTGGPLGNTMFLWRIEPFLYKIAGTKVVVMAYGGDIQDLTRCPNLLYKNALSLDYPEHRLRRRKIERLIDLWTNYSSHIIAGCDWVDYLYHWDTLMISHFCITDPLKDPFSGSLKGKPNSSFRILHAPNHRNIKGTDFIVKAIEELKQEGSDVELVILEKVSNTQVRETILTVDLVVDQLIIGWYAMFALEAMFLGKPVICHLRQDFIDLYTTYGLIQENEIPIINCTPLTIKSKIKELMENKDKLQTIGNLSRDFAKKYHSLEKIGETFHNINTKLNLKN
jgi:glycosyltransferase involved in cell wall biosynthesis